MLAVALFAVLIPFPFEAVLYISLVAIVVWFPLFFSWLAIYDASKTTGEVLAIFVSGEVLAIFVSLLVAFVILPLGPSDPVGAGGLLTHLALLLASGAGPFFAALRYFRRQPLASGHLLWAWVGLVWLASLIVIAPAFLYPISGVDVLGWLVQCSRLSLVVTVLLGLYGAKPAQTGAAWAHYLGWALMECTVIVWGWDAARTVPHLQW
jgi:hypothetical protein